MKGLQIISLGIGVIVIGIASFYLTNLFINWNKAEETSIAEQVIKTSGNASVTDRPNVSGTENDLSRMNSDGAVVIKTTLLTEKSSGNQIVFEVVLNTHSGNLLQYDFAKLANINFGNTNNNTGVFEWQPSNQDSHHLQGLLTWKGEIDKAYNAIELNLKDIDSIPSREFNWEKSKMIDEIFNR